jgi:hypothetical protein
VEGSSGGHAKASPARDDTLDLERVLDVFERNYGLRSDDFYRAHLRNDSVATDLPAWHREVWAGTYRQLLNSLAADPRPVPPR